MALGGKNKKSKGSKKKAKSSSYRTVGSIWSHEIETDKGDKEILNFSTDNQDPKDKYHKGVLLWMDKETGKMFKVKSMNVFPADKGPDNLLNKFSIDLDNEYHVEEVE